MTPLTVLTLVIMISYGKVNLNIQHLRSVIDRLPFSLCDGNVHRSLFPCPHLRWKLHPSEVLPAYPVQSLRKTNESRRGVSKRIQTFPGRNASARGSAPPPRTAKIGGRPATSSRGRRTTRPASWGTWTSAGASTTPTTKMSISSGCLWTRVGEEEGGDAIQWEDSY